VRTVLNKTTITKKGQVVIPADIRKRHNIRAGQKFLVEDMEDEIRLIPIQTISIKQASGWLKTKRGASELLQEIRSLDQEHEARFHRI